MPTDAAPQPEVSSVTIRDGLAHLDASIPVQGTFPVSLVHSLWTYYRKSAGALANAPGGTPAEYLNNFIKHLYKLNLIPEDAAEAVPALRSRGIVKYDALFTCYTLAGAFDALQHRAMVKATGSATSPRYQADPFFVPYAFRTGAPAILRYPSVWHASTSLNPTSTISALKYPGDLTRETVPLPDGVLVRRHVDTIAGNPDLVFHYDNAALALDSLRACQQYYLGHSIPFNAMLASLTLNSRTPGGSVSISASGLYPVREGFTAPDAAYTAPILCPYYMIMRLPTDAEALPISYIPRASSSVLISGEISFSRMTDEVFYDGVTELITGVPLPGTKFIFIADPAKIAPHREALRDYATAPDPNTQYHFCHDHLPYTCMYACEFRDGKLMPAKTFWSTGDTQFLRMLAQESGDSDLIATVDNLTERIK